jgi:plastocyanin domain-containing protein
VRVEVSAAGLITPADLQAVADTLGPAAGQQAYAYLPRVPLAAAAPPAETVPVGPDGVQALTLVVTPDGYSPAHFAVQRGVPVRLTFRQLGAVGCGNELWLGWGQGQSARLVLDTPGETETLEFTPGEAGAFAFACPHQIYRGLMTVVESPGPGSARD